MPNSTWIGSINIKDWIDSIYDTEMKQLKFISEKQMSQIKTTGAALNVQISTYGQLQGMVDAFKTSMSKVKEAFDSISYKIHSSDETVATAQITNNNVVPGAHVISVTQLAAAEKQTSQMYSSKTAELKINTTLELKVGATTVNVPIVSTDTLETARDKIKTATANMGVSATILATNEPGGAAQYQLVIASTKTGEINKVTFTDPGSNFGFTETTAAADAKFSFDGQNVVRSSNTITDVLDGLSFNLLKGLGATTTLSISETYTNRNENIKAAMHTMVDNYNKVIALIDKNQASTKTPDSTVDLLKANLSSAMAKEFEGTGVFKILADIGIGIDTKVPEAETTNVDGKVVKYIPTGLLTLNDDVLNSAITSDFTSFKALLFDTTHGVLNLASTEVDKQKIAVTTSTENHKQHVRDIDKKVSDEQLRMDTMKVELSRKYALLEDALAHMQFTSNYLSQQIDMMNMKK